MSKPIEITPTLIAYITSLPTKGDPILVTSKSPSLLEELIGSRTSKNSKGVMIHHISNLTIKWTTIIVSICLMNFGRPSNMKREMLEAIKNIALEGKVYN